MVMIMVMTSLALAPNAPASSRSRHAGAAYNEFEAAQPLDCPPCAMLALVPTNQQQAQQILIPNRATDRVKCGY
jgi:hypothetical protein